MDDKKNTQISRFCVDGECIDIYDEDVHYFVRFLHEKILHLEFKNQNLKKKVKKYKSGAANIPSPPPPPFDRKLKEGGYLAKPNNFQK